MSLDTETVTAKSQSDLFEAGARALRLWYRNEVRYYACEFLARIARGDIHTHEHLTDSLAQDLDGADLVIYTHKAQAVVFASDHDPEEDYDDADITDRLSVTPTTSAYYCLIADIANDIRLFDVHLTSVPSQWPGLTDADIEALRQWDINDDSTYPAQRAAAVAESEEGDA